MGEPCRNNCWARQIFNWMEGAAVDGGVTSADVAERFGMRVRLASAHLASMERSGYIKRVDRQLVPRDGPGWRNTYTVFVRADEVQRYHEG